jgi:hypothetical protein
MGFLVLLIGVTAVTKPFATSAQSSQTIYLPAIFQRAELTSCDVAGTSYGSLPIIPPPHQGNPATSHELNLGYRGYEPTTTALQLVNHGAVGDQNAPQFNTMFTNNRLPAFVRAYQRVRWVNGQPVDTQSSWGATVLGLGVTPGEIIEVPNSGYNIGNDYDVLVLYADPQRITLKYTREDSVAFGYTIYIEDVCIEPDLLALYETQHSNGRHSLPALSGNQPLGRAIGNEIKVAVRDTGHFLDPRSCNSWWLAFISGC